ncbi:hypothetical protein [Botrimarina hoheduenensis]|uniref:Uncharacterized protein n=1 Tax=Botrimarina hoheduenensis TaxID=2528000 RepID=A0A5C5VZI8_9BACT|nr:hypothetical protein [Botrimarina hoheduenensis]TWT43209.1 hypothetical protein Pla111_21590 [Botrimarina hoheduenensis]
MSNDSSSALGPSDSGLLETPKTPAYLRGRPQIDPPPDGNAMHEPLPVPPADPDRIEASLNATPLPDGMLSRLHRVIDEL